MLSNFSRQPERTVLNAMAFLGAIAIFIGLLIDSLILRDAGSVLIGVAVLMWGIAHLTSRDWTRETTFGRGSFWPILFIILGVFILIVVLFGQFAE